MISRLLLTGAAGNLGRHLRSSLRPYVQHIRLSDISAMAPAEMTGEIEATARRLLASEPAA